MKMFYDFEHDEFLTEKDLKRFYNLMSKEEKAEYNNVNHYMDCCLLKNNGCCIPFEQYEKELKTSISKIEINEYTIDDIVNKVLILQQMYDFKAKHN